MYVFCKKNLLPVVILSFDVIGMRPAYLLGMHIHIYAEGPLANDVAASYEFEPLISNHF